MSPNHPSDEVSIIPLLGIPEVLPHHDLGALLRTALDAAGLRLRHGDVLVISSKIVSKSQGLRVQPDRGAGAESYDDRANREALVLSQSDRVVAERATPTGMTRIVASHAGPVLAAAGVDDSNVGPHGGSLVLPADPDLAARTLYAGLLSAFAPLPLPKIGVIISDTAGRPWREGQVDFALGACGVHVLDDLRGGGHADVDGRALQATARAIADEIAAAADLVKAKTRSVPAALVRGLAPTTASPGAAGARSMIRTGPGDWFALGSLEAVRASLGAPPGSAAATSVGVASTAAEPDSARAKRVVDLALLGNEPLVEPDGVRICDDVIEVSIADAFARGRIAARLEVALHSERLTHFSVRPLSSAAGVSAAPSAGPSSAD